MESVFQEYISRSKMHFSGLIIQNGDGHTLHAAGIGEQSAVQEAVAKWHGKQPGLQSLVIGDEEYSALVLPITDRTVTLLSPAPGDAVSHFLSNVDFAWDIINQLINSPYDAMTVVDDQARLIYLSPVHAEYFGLKPGESLGKPVRDVIENTGLGRVVRTGKAEIGDIQHLNRDSRVVSRVPVVRDGKTIGAVGRVMFKGPEEVEALGRRVRELESEVAFYRREADALKKRSYGLDDIIGDGEAMAKLKADIIRIAPLDVPVLITGPSGVGKELVAHALHRLSPRRGKQMITVNAAALPATLVESELFGYAAGAFTGADRKGRKGKFELADDSTMFMDEIGDMPMEVQAKLLRVVQDGILDPVGGGKPRKVSFRLITATNQDLAQLVDQDRFRLDLYYRISPVVLQIPPLDARKEDIPRLARHFLNDFCARHGRTVPHMDRRVSEHLQAMSWPGNVRQLKNEVERAGIFCRGDQLTPDDFAEPIAGPATQVIEREPQPTARARTAPQSLKSATADIERDHIRETLDRLNGNKKKTAEALGISRSHLYKRLKELGLG